MLHYYFNAMCSEVEACPKIALGATTFHQGHNLPLTAHGELTQEQECIRNTCCTTLSLLSHNAYYTWISYGAQLLNRPGEMRVVFSQHLIHLIQTLVGGTEHKSFTLATPKQLHK